MAAFMVQYVVVRRDLLTTLKWPVGAVIAQACHASSAVIHLFYGDPNTQQYLKDLDHMHKVVLEVCVYRFLLYRLSLVSFRNRLPLIFGRFVLIKTTSVLILPI